MTLIRLGSRGILKLGEGRREPYVSLAAVVVVAEKVDTPADPGSGYLATC